MKKTLVLAILISISMLLIPLSTVKKLPKASAASTVLNEIPKAEKSEVKTFKVYDKDNDKVTEISASDYIFGVVAAEMPALYEEEALKAQAVAAYTFACCRKAENKAKPYDITTDHTIDQSFVTKEAAKEKWGENAEIYTEKIEKIVEETSGYVITHNGNLIVSVYHAVSSGKTEDCKNVWGKELVYLKSVLSEGDKLAENYISEVTFTTDELKKKLNEEVTFTGNPENYFGDIKKTDTGYVKEIALCKENISGSKLRSILNLRSTNFTVSYDADKFTFTVLGYGHGVGMSQNGANYMAKQGSDFKEILNHYYTDCKIEKI